MYIGFPDIVDSDIIDVESEVTIKFEEYFSANKYGFFPSPIHIVAIELSSFNNIFFDDSLVLLDVRTKILIKGLFFLRFLLTL